MDPRRQARAERGRTAERRRRSRRASGPGETGRIPDTVTESLVLQKGETYYGKGEAFFRDGDFVSASRYLQATSTGVRIASIPAYLLGISLWKEGVLDGAIVSLTRAATLGSEVGEGPGQSREGPERRGTLRRCPESGGRGARHRFSRLVGQQRARRALLNLGRRDEAIEAFRTAVERIRATPMRRTTWVTRSSGPGRFSDAVPFLEEAVRLKPGVGIFQNNLGMATSAPNTRIRRSGRIARR